MELLIIIVESIVILLTILKISQNYREQKKSKVNTLFVSTLIIDIIENINSICNPASLFEMERKIRRMILFIKNKVLQNQSLLWFHENGIQDDLVFIETAIKNGCIRERNSLTLARDIIIVINNRHLDEHS